MEHEDLKPITVLQFSNTRRFQNLDAVNLDWTVAITTIGDKIVKDAQLFSVLCVSHKNGRSLKSWVHGHPRGIYLC